MKTHCLVIVLLGTAAAIATDAEPPATPAPSSREPQQVTLPPEVWQALLRQSQTPLPTSTIGFPRLGPAGRSLLGLLAATVVAVGFIAARQLGRHGGVLDQGYAVWFLLGLFGAVAALLVAAAATGSLYLHVSGAVCTVLSGFSILGWLSPQWTPLRRWVRGETKSQPHKEIRHAGDAENANA